MTVDLPAAARLRTWERGLAQILSNLSDNALKYSRRSSPPRVHVDGEEALQFIGSHAAAGDPEIPLLVLLDLRLPKVDGIEVLRAARQHPVWKWRGSTSCGPSPGRRPPSRRCSCRARGTRSWW